jgi:methionine-rich copper-binding protein CopC
MNRARLLPLALVALVAALLPSGLALAHAHYDHSTPSIGQVLATAPQRVDIYTDSEMRRVAGGNVITVADASGNSVDDGNTVLDDNNRQHFSVGLQPNVPPGRYVVSFKTLSDVDGDADSGKFAFYVGAGPTDAQKQLDATLNGQPISLSDSRPSARSSTSVALFGAAGALVALLGAAAALIVAHSRRSRPSI